MTWHSASSSCWEVSPLTDPWVPTGMNMGVSQTPWGSVMRAVRARPRWARTSKVRAGDWLDGRAGVDGDVIVCGGVIGLPF